MRMSIFADIKKQVRKLATKKMAYQRVFSYVYMFNENTMLCSCVFAAI